MDALTYLATRHDLDLTQRSPIEIPNIGRDGLARLFYLLGYADGAEIGVERAAYSRVLCEAIPGLRLRCVDAWRPYPGYRDHVMASKLERFYTETQAALAPYPRVTIVRQWSVEAAKAVPNGSLDFVYLDANHAIESVIADLAAWVPKVRAGGMIAGHDYVRHQWPNRIHVVQAINAWTDAYEIRPWFLLGQKAKVPGEVRDDARSWCWVHDPKPAWRKGMKVPQQ